MSPIRSVFSHFLVMLFWEMFILLKKYVFFIVNLFIGKHYLPFFIISKQPILNFDLCKQLKSGLVLV